MTAYYNEIDPFAAQWLRNLIDANLIAPGDVDERSIEDICPNELDGYTQCHFFAGIGVWSYALRQAGWPDDKPVWTGSCPCQPFSTAGKGAGFTDERHLWPAWHYLIQQSGPGAVFGEQVASKDGLAWLNLVQNDMENTGYAFGAVDLCAAGVGAPHIRQRLFFVANASISANGALNRKPIPGPGSQKQDRGCSISDQLAYADSQRRNGQQNTSREAGRIGFEAGGNPSLNGTADTSNNRRSENGECELSARSICDSGNTRIAEGKSTAGPTNGYWRDADWLFCQDGKFRPVEPGTFPLADGASARVGRLRGYGNAINAKAAQAFIESYMECKP